MTQNPEHTRSRCPTCGADRGEECLTRDGRTAEKVHYGRPYWSGKVLTPAERLSPAEELTQLEQHRAAWRTITDLMPGAEFVSHEAEFGFAELMTVTVPRCEVCGDPYALAGLTVKCRDRHEVCRDCGARYDQPKNQGCRRRKHPKGEPVK